MQGLRATSALSCVLLFLVLEVKGQVVFGCEKDFCAKRKTPCKEEYCRYGRVVENATQCGCCHVCVMPQDENELCSTSEVNKIPRVECGPGMQCQLGEKVCRPCRAPEKGCQPDGQFCYRNPSVCKTGSTECMKDLAEINTVLSGQELSTGKPKPKCDQFGYFEPVQCKTGMLCYCVDRDGKRIFGTSPYTEEEDLNCKCSRDFVELVRFGLFRGDNVTFLRCDSQGSYEEVQCTEDSCYCISKEGDQLALPMPNKNWDISTLTCYNSKRHPANFKTPCIREREQVLKRIQDARDQEEIILGLEPPSCDLDGTYAPVQCQGQVCYCVDKEGTRYYQNNKQRYVVQRYSKLATNMTCNCQREKELFKTMKNNNKKTEIFAGYKCNVNGNYLPIQCSTNVCYCVDENGFQDGDKAVIIADIKDLTQCYDEDYKNILGILD